MHITEADIAILVPAFQTPEMELQKFFQQISCLDVIPFIFFVYEKDSCNFDFTDKVRNWSEANDAAYHILTLNGRMGLGYALNAAIGKIEQPFVMRHDLGDDFLENRVDDVIQLLNDHSNVDILYSQAFLFDGISEKRSSYPTTKTQLKRSFVFGNPICHPTVVFKRTAILRIGNYDPTLRFCEDLDLWLRAVSAGLQFYCLDWETIRYNMPEDVRVSSNWYVNLRVRLKNFGKPNFAYSILGIIVIVTFLVLPNYFRKWVYKYVKN